jgi:hypothetical protein
MVEAVFLGILFVIVAGVPMWSFYARRRAMRRLLASLRNMVLDTPQEQDVVMMDIGKWGVVVSVMSTSLGDASLYLSFGGGVLGGFDHENVREAAKAFVADVKAAVGGSASPFAITTDHPYPEVGEVRCYFRTAETLHVAAAEVRDIEAKRSELWPLWIAGQNVIAQLRLISPGPS